MRPLVILNPAAGRGEGRAWRDRLARAMRAVGWAPDLVETTKPGEGALLARAAVDAGRTLVIAVGGDGTVHEVANGLLDAPPAVDGATRATLGVIPVGTGNDFARLLGLRPGRPERAVARLREARSARFEVGRVEAEYFVNGMGAGFGAAVVRCAAGVRGLGGKSLYLAAACRAFVTFRPVTMRIDAGAFHETAPMTLVEVLVGRSAGGGFLLSPAADPSDGLLDLCAVRALRPVRFAIGLVRVLQGTHGGLAEVTLVQTDSVRIATMDAPLHMHLDGECRAATTSEICVTVEPGRLRVLLAG